MGWGTGVSTVAIPGSTPGDSKVADIAEFSLSRGTEFFAGGINETVTAADETTDQEFRDKGLQEVLKGLASNPGDLKKLVQP